MCEAFLSAKQIGKLLDRCKSTSTAPENALKLRKPRFPLMATIETETRADLRNDDLTPYSDEYWIQYRVSIFGVLVFVLMMAAIFFFAEGLADVPWSV